MSNHAQGNRLLFGCTHSVVAECVCLGKVSTFKCLLEISKHFFFNIVMNPETGDTQMDASTHGSIKHIKCLLSPCGVLLKDTLAFYKCFFFAIRRILLISLLILPLKWKVACVWIGFTYLLSHPEFQCCNKRRYYERKKKEKCTDLHANEFNVGFICS